jgi:polar amino acid transport system substrate-binding protein
MLCPVKVIQISGVIAMHRGWLRVIKRLRRSLEACRSLTHIGLRVLEDRFTGIEQAIALPKADEETWRYLCAFVEDAKASGFVARALEASG